MAKIRSRLQIALLFLFYPNFNNPAYFDLPPHTHTHTLTYKHTYLILINVPTPPLIRAPRSFGTQEPKSSLWKNIWHRSLSFPQLRKRLI